MSIAETNYENMRIVLAISKTTMFSIALSLLQPISEAEKMSVIELTLHLIGNCFMFKIGNTSEYESICGKLLS
jgi:hypothetical protein